MDGRKMRTNSKLKTVNRLAVFVLATPLVVAFLVSACGPPETPVDRVGCWVTTVIGVSSEATDRPSSNLMGPADIEADWHTWDDAPYCSDNPVAWSPSDMNAGTETVEVRFEQAIQVDRVRVFENFGPGTAKLVTLTNSQNTGVPTLVFAVPGDLQGPGQSCGVLDVDVDMADGFEFSRDTYDNVLIEFDTAQVTGWNEVDAIMLAGQVPQGTSIASCEPYEFVPPEETPTPTP